MTFNKAEMKTILEALDGEARRRHVQGRISIDDFHIIDRVVRIARTVDRAAAIGSAIIKTIDVLNAKQEVAR